MEWVEVLARCVLAVTFVVAGVAKLRDLEAVERSAADLGAPPGLERPIARALPFVEIGIAVALLVAPTAWAAAALAAGLLTAFTVALTLVVVRGESVRCRCFGEVSSEPVGPASLVRNSLLLVLAIAVLVGGEQVGIPGWLDERDAAEAVVFALALLSAALLTAVVTLTTHLRATRAQLAAVGGPSRALRRGDTLPGVAEARRRDGTSVSLVELPTRGPAVVVWVGETCGPCHEMLPDLAAWQRALGPGVGVHVIADRADGLDALGVPLPDLLLDPGNVAMDACGVEATPSAFAVDARGRVTHGTVAGAVAIEALVRSV